MTPLSLLILLAAAPSWRQDVLSDAPEVRTPALAHLHARGRSGLFAVQNLVETSTDTAERVRALRALGELGDPEAEWELRAQIKQPSPHVVAAAVTAAQRLRLAGMAHTLADKVGDPDAELCEALGTAATLYPAIAESARAALEGDESRQLAGLRVLQAAGLAVDVTVARRLAASPLPEVRLAAAVSLGKTDPEAALKIVADLLQGPLADEAVDVLARLGTPQALEQLTSLLDRPQPDQRVVVALARTTAGDRILIERRASLPADSALASAIDAAIDGQPGTTDRLLPLLSNPEDAVADAVAVHIGRHAPGLLILERCLERQTTQAAHCATGLAANPAATAEIESALRSLEPAIRALMVSGLGQSPRPSALPSLSQLASDPSPDVRVALAAAAGRFGAAATDLLTTLVHDGQPEVRAAAASAVVPLLPADRLRILAAEAVGDPALRGPMLSVLTRLPIKDGIRLVRALLQDPSVPERRQAMLAMAQFHDPEAVNALMDSAASETDPTLRELAYSMLANQ